MTNGQRIDGPLQLCVVAKMTYPARVRDQQQDMATYRALKPWVRRVYLIVTSAGDKRHLSHDGPVVAIHIAYGRNPVLRWLRFLVAGWLAGRRIVRRRRIDVVMAAEPFAGGILGLALSRGGRLPLLVHIQGDLLDLPAALVGRLRVRAMRWLTLAIARRATLVRCISRGVERSCIDAGLPAARLRLLPIRVNLERFNPAGYEDDRRAMRATLRVASDELLILSVGSLTIHKGYPVLLDAFSRVRAADTRVKLAIAGEGPERQRLAAMIDRLGLTGAVTLTGWVMYAQVPGLLASCDVYAQPSFDEGIPRSVLEAMAMARPIVASRVGGIPELVRDEETGLLVPPNDPAALADRLGSLCRDASLRGRLGHAGRTATKDYEMAAAISRYGALLEETAGRPRVMST